MRFSARESVAGCVFVIAMLYCAVNGAEMWRARTENAVIIGYAAGRDTPLKRDADAVLRAARGVFLLAHDRVDDAQAELDSIDAAKDPGPRAILQHGLANAHLRRALQIFSSAPMRRVAPLIGLARSEYREVLRIEPENFDARYNFTIASTLSHDPEVAAYLKGDDMARERALVPDAPGAPDGLP